LKKFSLLSALLVAGLFFFLQRDKLIRNGIENGSFENGSASWNGPGDCSMGRPGVPVIEGKIARDVKADGENSFEIDVQHHLACLSTRLNGLKTGKYYRISFLAKTDQESGIDINVYEGAHFLSLLDRSVRKTKGGWRRYAFNFKVDAELDAPSLMVYVDGGDLLREVYLDKFEIYELGAWHRLKLERHEVVPFLAHAGFASLKFIVFILVILFGAAATGVILSARYRSLSGQMALLCGSLLFSLLAIDVYCYRSGLAQDGQQKKFTDMARNGHKKIDLRRPEEAQMDLWRRGENIFPYYPPLYFLGEPDLVSKYLPGPPETDLIYCNENGYYMRFRTDRRGFNNPVDIDPGQGLDAAFLGDSFTFGACVDQGKNFVDRFREHVPRTLNFGIPASGPLFQYVIFREFVEEFRPKTVVWNFISNDFDDLKNEMQSGALVKYLSDPRLKQVHWDSARAAKLRDDYRKRFLKTNQARLNELNEGLFMKTLRLFHLRAFVENVRLNHAKIRPFAALPDFFTLGATADAASPKSPPTPAVIDPSLVQTYRWILADVAERIKASHGQLYIYFDDYYAASDAFPVRAIAGELGIPIIDISQDVLRELNSKGIPIFRPGHYSESGYAFVGDRLYEAYSHR